MARNMRVEQYREDLALEDSDSRPWCLLEVKGTNKGIKREFINQADNHRERAGKGSDFPSLLIVNPLISKARAIDDKNREVAREQVDHAAKNNILVLRTLDLLNLLRRYMNEDISSDEVRKLFSSNAGWLEVTESEYKIHS